MTQTRNLIDETGKRTDGRTAKELRNVQIKVGVVKNADGSALIEFGKNKIVVGVYGPREVHPKHMAQTDRGILRCRYHMSPFSTDTRKNPAPSRREVEISKVIREALEPSLILEDYPRATIDVYIEVLQALADAGINMRDMVSACAAGKVDDKIVLDINDTEDKEGGADMPVAFMPNLKRITLLQLDGILDSDQFNTCLDEAIYGCNMVYEIQRSSLMQKYFGNEPELKNIS
jgi:exosome complex component RRP41